MTAKKIMELKEGAEFNGYVDFDEATLPKDFTIANNTIVEDRLFHKNVKVV